MRSHAKAPSAGSVWIAGAAALIFALALLAISSPPASAVVEPPLVRAFSTGPGINGSIATDDDGNVYLFKIDAFRSERYGVERIEKFDSNGNPVPFTGSAPYIAGNKVLGTPEGNFNNFGQVMQVAIDNSGGPNDGNIYLGLQNRVVGFDASGTYLGRFATAKEWTCGVAVDQVDGSIYVSTAAPGVEGGPGIIEVLHYTSPGATLDAVSPFERLKGVWGCNMALDSAGSVYIGSYGQGIRKFDPSQWGAEAPTPSVTFDLPGAEQFPVALDETGGALYGGNHGQVARWDANGVGGAPIEAFGQFNFVSGLTVDPNRNLLVADNGGGILVFGPNRVQLPTGQTGGSVNVGPAAADVEGTADPDGAGTITSCEFRYGEDTGYTEGSVPCAPGSPLTAATTVSAHLSGLVSGTTYHYRLFLTNANGTQANTGDRTFATPLANEGVTTQPATEVGKESAALNGSYLGDGQDVHYFFEWGRSEDYDHVAPLAPGDAGNEAGPQNVAPIQISGLEGERTYHYRLVISTPSGITRGQDESFTTPAAVTGLTTGSVTSISDQSAELHASFEGDGTRETHYFFEWGPSVAYGSKTPIPPGVAVPPSNGKVELDPVAIGGLDGGATYHYRVVASNSAGTTFGSDRAFKTAEAPVVSNLDTRNVTASSAELTAAINPRYGQTEYHFEWGPTAAYGNSVPVPVGELAPGESSVPVSAKIEGLTLGLTYHFRLIASNQYGSVTSPDQSFGFYPPACPNSQLRQETRSNDLPDCRGYELVTPSFAQGATIMPSSGPVSGVATNPPRLAFGAVFGLLPETTGEGMNSINDLYVATRSDTGWTQRYIGLRGTEGVFMGGPPAGYLPSPTLGIGPRNAQRGTQATPSLDRVINYNWGFPGNTTLRSPGSNNPYLWDTTTGNLVERWPTNLAATPEGQGFVGFPQASPDLSHFVFSSNVVFAPGGEASGGKLECCEKTPSFAQVWPEASIYDNDVESGAVELASRTKTGLPFKGRAFDISDDGTHILMTREAAFVPKEIPVPLEPKQVIADAEIPGPLYLRVNGDVTYEIAPGHQLRYAGSTSDGATVYFTSSDPLTPDDHDFSRDLFVWRESDPGSLTRVSVGDHGNAGNTDECVPSKEWTVGCGVSAVVVNLTGGNGHSDGALASESGDIYFESPEQLVGAKGEQGARNLYLFRAGTLRYVATVEGGRRITRIQVTPDGRFMALVTASNLTGYNSGGRAEMYSYDAGGGPVFCVSCPNGPAASDVTASQNGLFLAYDGRAFFQTKDALVRRDTNQAEDVYEFTEGKAQLITTGVGPGLEVGNGGQGEPGLVSVSANGTDVYFATIDNLVSQDHNGATVKIYDARTGGGFPAERESPKCVAADECHGPGAAPPSPPADRTSASLGNPVRKATKKTKTKKQKKARKQKHRKKRAGKADAKRHTDSGKQGGKHHG